MRAETCEDNEGKGIPKYELEKSGDDEQDASEPDRCAAGMMLTSFMNDERHKPCGNSSAGCAAPAHQSD